jgi:hypothetical protein
MHTAAACASPSRQWTRAAIWLLCGKGLTSARPAPIIRLGRWLRPPNVVPYAAGELGLAPTNGPAFELKSVRLMASDLREAPPDDPLERSLPGSRYGIVLLLLLATFVFMAAGFSGSWVALVTVALQGATLLAALVAAGVGHRIRRLTMLLVLVTFAGATVATFFSSGNVQGGLFLS